MKSATDSIAVIRTRLPYLDRRALSEAWFSALHLARDGRLAVPQRRASDAGGSPPPASPRSRVASPLAAPATGGPPVAERNQMRRATGPLEGGGELRVRTERGRAARGATSLPIPPPLDASFTLTIEGARVQMLVRRDGPTLRITAICAAAHLEAVRRALASADLAMRLRGHLVESKAVPVGARETPA